MEKWNRDLEDEEVNIFKIIRTYMFYLQFAYIKGQYFFKIRRTYKSIQFADMLAILESD